MEPVDAPYILIVEDDAPSRDLLRRRLERSGLRVITAADGPQALSTVAQEPPAAVILDIGLPGMDGLAVLQALRRQYSALELPVLMATAFDADAHLPKALALGANDFVNKPIDFTVLRARLQTQLQLRQATRSQRELLASQELILAGSNDGIWEWDPLQDRIRNSRRWYEVLNENTPEQLETDSSAWFSRVHPEDLPRLQAMVEEIIAPVGNAIFAIEYRIRDGVGRYRWVLTRGAVQRDSDGTALRAAGTHSDISTLRYCDRSTGLPTKQALLDTLALLQQEAARSDSSWALLSLQLDDRVGFLQHLSGGEQLMKNLAESLRQIPAVHSFSVDDGSYALLLLLYGEGQADFQATIDAIQELLRTGLVTPLGPVSCQGYMGLHHQQCALTDSPEKLCMQVRRAAQLAREQGREIVFVDDQVLAQMARSESLTHDLRGALAENAVQPWWQALVHHDGSLAGFEVLARWRKADNSMVSPAEFIPLYEKAGLIGELTWRMLAQSCQQFRRWQDLGLVDEAMYFAVNVPPGLLTTSLLGRLQDILAAHALHPQQLCVEVTESSAIVDFAVATDTLEALAKAGFRLALDDFGTGYASLNTLHRLPFHTLKIDQSFVRQMDQGQESHSLIRAIIRMGQSLGLQVVAEGVETAEQVVALRALGIDRMQGYYFCLPNPAEKVEAQWRSLYPLPDEAV